MTKERKEVCAIGHAAAPVTPIFRRSRVGRNDRLRPLARVLGDRGSAPAAGMSSRPAQTQTGQVHDVEKYVDLRVPRKLRSNTLSVRRQDPQRAAPWAVPRCRSRVPPRSFSQGRNRIIRHGIAEALLGITSKVLPDRSSSPPFRKGDGLLLHLPSVGQRARIGLETLGRRAPDPAAQRPAATRSPHPRNATRAPR